VLADATVDVMVTPPEIPDPPRVVWTADAPALGISRRELSGPLWQPAWRGVHIWHNADKKDPAVRLPAVAPLLPPGAALGAWAALHARGVHDVDGRIGLTGKTRPILVCVGSVGLIDARPGLIIDRGRFPADEITICSGVPVVCAERAICQIARRYGVAEGVAAADAACRAAVTTPQRLRDFVARQGGRPGVPAMRLTAHLVDPRAASIQESHFRYVWVVIAGLPRPLVNAKIMDDESGFVVGSPDLLDRDAGLVGEYDGATHRELAAHTNDNNREEGFESRNLIVVRATSIDVWPRRAELVRRIQNGRERGLARDRSRDNWGLRIA
jgi:hypothetical protein